MKSLCITLFLALAGAVPANAATISGTVRHALTRAPLPNVNISINNRTMGTTDLTGAFTLIGLSPGRVDLAFSHIGFSTVVQFVEVRADNSTRQIHILLEVENLSGGSSVVTANREYGEWMIWWRKPTSFTILTEEELKEVHTTGDLPDLVKHTPGLWSSSAGLGEAELSVRGFSGEKVNYFVNGIPMNEPENREMNWSDWSGLSSMIGGIQVVKGSTFIAQSSGAFGGAIRFETRMPQAVRANKLRASTGVFRTSGASAGPEQGRVADGSGFFVDGVAAIHYVFSLEHHTGSLWDDRVRATFTVERKVGDSNLQGTTYDGTSVGINGIGQFGRHRLSLGFLWAPQSHDQATSLQDAALLETLGREYNRVNHPWRYDHSSRPVWSLEDRWHLSDRYVVLNHAFFSMGTRESSRLIDGVFDVDTGELGFQPTSLVARDYRAFGRHAGYILDAFGILLDGYTPPQGGDPPLFANHEVRGTPAILFTQQNAHSWQSVMEHSHHQVGFSTQLDGRQSDGWQWLAGGNGEAWYGTRKGRVERARFAEPSGNGQATLIADLQDTFDYNTRVLRMSAFARTSIDVGSRLSLHAGAHLASTEKSVDEEAIGFFNFAQLTGRSQFFFDDEPSFLLRTSADQVNASGEPKFTDDDYRRRYTFLSPWIGLTAQLSEDVDVYANLSKSSTEPAIADWYDPDKGPLDDDARGVKLDPEHIRSVEVGFRTTPSRSALSLAYYRSLYSDKIESVIDALDRRETLNVGSAVFQGVEFSARYVTAPWTLSLVGAMSRNRWEDIDAQEIFGEDADEVAGRVVPFSPERMASARVGYTHHRYDIGLELNWWDRYYATFTNDYVDAGGTRREAKLPYFLEAGLKLSYKKPIGPNELRLRLNLHNVLNRRDNFQRAQFTADPDRNDSLANVPSWYVLQAPLFNVYITAEVGI